MDMTVPGDVKVDDDAVIRVNLPDDASGDVFMDIDGVTKNITVKNGVAEFTFNNLTVGNHNIVVNHVGDDKYSKGVATDVISISKNSNYTINISSSENLKAGDKAVINITLPSDANGVVSVTVGNKTYNTAIKNDNGSIIADELTTGEYAIT